MKKRGLIFLSIIFIVISLFQFSKVSEAANYDTEIGLTFNSDVASGSDSTSSSKIESNTSETSQTSTNKPPSNKEEFPETMTQKITKSGLDRFLPNTGTIKNLFYLIFGCLILTGLFMFIGFKSYKVFRKNTQK